MQFNIFFKKRTTMYIIKKAVALKEVLTKLAKYRYMYFIEE